MSITITKNAEETKKFAFDLAKNLLSKPNKEKNAIVLALEGVLGAGKTTFTQGFAKGLGAEEAITSPTFVILKEYEFYKHHVKEITNHKSQIINFKKFYHIDCYRLKDEGDLDSIGFFEILKDPKNIILIEWAGKIKKALPEKYISIKFYYISENKRKISMN